MILLNNNSNFLIILVGLPASGKSTFALKLKGKLESVFQNKVKIIDPDVIRDEDFPNNFDFKNEPQIREKNIDSVRKHLNKGQIVISDDLNYYSSMRHDLKLIAVGLNLQFFIIHISTPLKFCLKRNEERGKPIPNKVISKIYNKFDNFNKYKWDTPFETYDYTKSGDLIQFIEILSNKIAINLKEQKKIKTWESELIKIKREIDKTNVKVDQIKAESSRKLNPYESEAALENAMEQMVHEK